MNLLHSRRLSSQKLWHFVSEDIYKYDISKCVSVFDYQCNIFLGNFKYTKYPILGMSCFINIVQHFIVARFFIIFNNCIQELYTVGHLAIRIEWRVSWTTHYKRLPHLAHCMDI